MEMDPYTNWKYLSGRSRAVLCCIVSVNNTVCFYVTAGRQTWASKACRDSKKAFDQGTSNTVHNATKILWQWQMYSVKTSTFIANFGVWTIYNQYLKMYMKSFGIVKLTVVKLSPKHSNKTVIDVDNFDHSNILGIMV